jgi:hypothetical protein
MPEPINEVTEDVIDQVVATRSGVQSTVSRSSPASLLGELQGQRSLLTGRAVDATSFRRRPTRLADREPSARPEDFGGVFERLWQAFDRLTEPR